VKQLFRDNVIKMTGYTSGYQPQEPDVIKINTNENPYPPSPKVLEAIKAVHPDRLRLYPPKLWDPFRQAASKELGVAPETIVCGNGGDEILTILVRCCCDAGRPLAYPTLTYSLYPELAAIQGCQALETPYEDYHDIPAGLFTANAGLTIVCNPNAPSGTFVSLEKIAALAERVPGVLLIDEAYVDFAPQNCLPLLKDFDNIAILRSMSKGYSLAGLRFGFCITSLRIVEAMCKVKDSYNVNYLSQVAAAAAIQDQTYFKQNVQKIIAQREKLVALLQSWGLYVPPSHTNFILVTFGDPLAKQIYDQLVARKIYVRYFHLQGLTDKLRISIGSEEENEALIGALKEILKRP